MRDYVVQFLTQAGYFAAVLFLPIYAKETLGATEFQVGLIVAGGNVAGFLSSFAFGRLADVRGRRAVVPLGVGAASIAATFQIFAFDPLTFGLSWFAFGFAQGSFPGALVAHAFEAGRAPGRFSSLGSLGWGTGTFLAGIVAVALNEKWAFALASLLFLVAFVAAFGIPFRTDVRVDVPRFPLAVIRRNWPVYAAILVRHTGANMIWLIFPLFLAQDLRMTPLEVGVIYSVNAFTQFAVMFFAVDRFRSTRLVFAGLGLSAVTFLTFTFARSFWEMVPTQIALGASWAFLYAGSLTFVLERGVERATSSGLLGSALLISATIGPLVGGAVAQAFGRTMPMYVASVLAVVALGVFATALRRSEAGKVDAPPDR